MRLRFWFLLPARIWLGALLAAPMAIVCVYSALTRGAYGGVTLPWNAGNFTRVFDSLYGSILLRSLAVAAAATALLRVVVPLSAPGIRAGSILVFIPCVGAFLTPDLLGGGKTVMIGNLVQNQFTTARDWPFGSAVSLLLMAIVVLLVVVFLRGE